MVATDKMVGWTRWIPTWMTLSAVFAGCANAGPVRFHPIRHVWGANAPDMVPDSIPVGSRVFLCGGSGNSTSASVDSSVHAFGLPDWEWESYLSSKDPDLEVAVSGNGSGRLDCRTLDALPDSKRNDAAMRVVDSLIQLMSANEYLKDSLGSGGAQCKAWSQGKVCFARNKNGKPGPIVAISRTGAHAVLSSTCSASFLALSIGGQEYLYSRETGCGMGLTTTRVFAFSGKRWESKLVWDFE